MTREEILKEYAIDENGVITSPGKFEGEMLYMPYFWNVFLDGGTMASREGHLLCDVTKEDREEFPELKGRRSITFDENDQGFIYEIRRL